MPSVVKELAEVGGSGGGREEGAGHSTVLAVAEELAEVGPVAAGVSHTHQHLLPWERAHALNAPGALAPAPLPVVHVPLQPLASLPSLRYLSIGSCDGLRWWG